MRLFKRLTAVFMVVIISATCCACSADRNRTAKKLDIEKKTTITIWYNDDSYTPYLEQVSKEFHNANELVTILPVFVNAQDYLGEIYNESVQNDNATDIYLLSSDELSKAYYMGLLSENNEYTSYYTEKTYGKAGLKACSYQGKLYGYPLSFNTSFMVYNKKYVSGVYTFNELKDYCNSYEVNDDNQDLQVLVSWDVSDIFTNYAFASKYISTKTDNTGDGYEVQINDDQLKRTMEEYYNAKETFGISREDVDSESVAQLFSEGKLAYSILDAKHLNVIAQSNVDYGIGSVPSLSENLDSQTISDTTMAIVNPFSGNLKVSKAVAHALSYDYASEMQGLTGQFCARSNVYGKKEKEAYKNLYQIYSESTVKDQFIGAGEIYLRYGVLIHQIWDGKDIPSSLDAFKTSLKATSK
jgi:maltose-binding protein MalE